MPSVSSANNTFISSYDQSGRALMLRSEPTKRIPSIFAQSSTTPENYKDKVTLSADGIEKSQQGADLAGEETNPEQTGQREPTVTKPQAEQEKTPAGTARLTPAEEKTVQQLKARDQEVKTHEMAHLASAGQYARGGPSYSYQQGPDGRRYAIGGEVPIDIGEEKTPEETIEKMRSVRRAALAPAEPSAADRSIAAAASALESQARSQLQAEKTGSTERSTEPSTDTPPESNTEPASKEEAAAPRRTLDIRA